MSFDIYLDIDGVLLANDRWAAIGVHEFLEYVLERYPTYWLTTHCKGDAKYTLRVLSEVLEPNTLELAKRVQPTNWNTAKTEAINFSRPFLWFDDDLFGFEKDDLLRHGALENWIGVDLMKNPDALSKFVADFPIPFPQETHLETKIEVVRGDITRLRVDAIVNSCNWVLSGQGGVSGSILKAGGNDLKRECQVFIQNRGPLLPSEAVITSGGKLPCKHVIHVLGPQYFHDQNPVQLLEASYRNALSLAVQHGITTIAFPCISTGSFRFPREQASQIAIHTVVNFLQKKTPLKKIIFCVYSEEDRIMYKTLIKE